MSARRRPTLKPLIYLMVVALASTAAAAGAAERPRVLRAAAPGVIELPSGERIDLALPAGAALAGVEPLAGGWIAAGTRPAGDGRRIVLLAALPGAASGPVPLPAPRPAGRLQGEPLPLVEDGRLAGLVWLEGDEAQRLAVRFARWNGAAWGKPRTISAAGPGSQLALAAARLADGSWLLAWSAFDGHDDEILWSRFDGRAWGRPARVAPDDEVPDITPAVTAMGDGALLAWSRFDGDGYETVAARFSPAGERGGRFSPPRAVAPSGSAFPSFEPAVDATPGDGALLLTRTAAPRGWSVTEIDASGAARRRAAIAGGAAAGPASERPVVLGDAGGVALRFPASGERRAAPWEPLAPLAAGGGEPR
jgi:hypothetical protein